MDVWLLTSTSTPTRTAQVLSEVFGFHPTALRACTERNQIPTLHAYQDHVFVVLHAPEPGVAGHVHLLELDQFIGRRFLVTVHGPINPVVAIVSALARRQRSVIATVAGKVSALEGRVMGEDLRSPEPLLERCSSFVTS